MMTLTQTFLPDTADMRGVNVFVPVMVKPLMSVERKNLSSVTVKPVRIFKPESAKLTAV
jgi:hypothetical protein